MFKRYESAEVLAIALFKCVVQQSTDTLTYYPLRNKATYSQHKCTIRLLNCTK